MMFGNPSSFALDLRWPAAEPADVVGLGWGYLLAWVDGRAVWATDGGEPVAWTWIDLLAHLARAWGHLLHEENAPFGLIALTPDALRSPRILGSVPDHTPQEVEEAVHAFLHRHDLAAGLNGIFLPRLALVRVGREVAVRSCGQEVFVPAHEVWSVLTQFGDAVCTHLDAPAPRAVEAVARWRRREDPSGHEVSWATGLDAETARQWTRAGQSPRAWWHPDQPRAVAARLSQPLDLATRRALVEAVDDLGPQRTPALDALTDEAMPVVRTVKAHKPYVQGYELALWLRARLGLGDAPIDPDALLREWGVHVASLKPLAPAIDAVAVWGAGVGPAVLVNPNGKHSGSVAGRRTTLGHEIGHLLVDRHHQLPVAEVMGGATPLHLEQRARAFAAEFLLPRAVAARALARGSTLKEVGDGLMQAYGVSREVVGWQLRNGPSVSSLNRSERALLARWCQEAFAPNR